MRISGKSALHPQMPRRVEACWASSFHRYTSLGHKGGKLLHARPSSRVPIDCGRVGRGRMERSITAPSGESKRLGTEYN